MLYRIYNENNHVLKERFKGEEIVIPPGGYVVMDHDDMIHYKGQFLNPRIENGVPDPRARKHLRIVEHVEGKVAPEAPKPSKEFVCQACGFEAKNKAGLSAHSRHNHLNQMIGDDGKVEVNSRA